jgi:hypothetical protein
MIAWVTALRPGDKRADNASEDENWQKPPQKAKYRLFSPHPHTLSFVLLTESA